MPKCSSNIKELRKLIEKPDSCLVVKHDQDLELKIWPQYFNDLERGIAAALKQITGGYNKE